MTIKILMLHSLLSLMVSITWRHDFVCRQILELMNFSYSYVVPYVRAIDCETARNCNRQFMVVFSLRYRGDMCFLMLALGTNST